ncbi:MAG TPA: hypothetical protein VJR89_36200 [Polyangiales bacterium]|nr:hypothetical protein [Polyangiales bacterium]
MTSALLWTQRGIALALLLQTVELLQLRRRFADDGVWSWPILRREQLALPALLRWLLDWAMPYRAFVALLVARLACCIALLGDLPYVLPILLFSQIAICVRCRGTFNGGSDYMSVQVLLALNAALWPPLQRAALLYIAVQSVLSYFNAGVVKLKEPSWRDGSALLALLRARAAPVAQQLAAALATPLRRRIAARGVIALEACAAPLALIDPRLCAGFLALGLGFHTLNAYVFGLNRFLFAWAATYPALFFCSELLGAST